MQKSESNDVPEVQRRQMAERLLRLVRETPESSAFRKVDSSAVIEAADAGDQTVFLTLKDDEGRVMTIGTFDGGLPCALIWTGYAHCSRGLMSNATILALPDIPEDDSQIHRQLTYFMREYAEFWNRWLPKDQH